VGGQKVKQDFFDIQTFKTSSSLPPKRLHRADQSAPRLQNVGAEEGGGTGGGRVVFWGDEEFGGEQCRGYGGEKRESTKWGLSPQMHRDDFT